MRWCLSVALPASADLIKVRKRMLKKKCCAGVTSTFRLLSLREFVPLLLWWRAAVCTNDTLPSRGLVHKSAAPSQEKLFVFHIVSLFPGSVASILSHLIPSCSPSISPPAAATKRKLFWCFLGEKTSKPQGWNQEDVFLKGRWKLFLCVRIFSPANHNNGVHREPHECIYDGETHSWRNLL